MSDYMSPDSLNHTSRRSTGRQSGDCLGSTTRQRYDGTGDRRIGSINVRSIDLQYRFFRQEETPGPSDKDMARINRRSLASLEEVRTMLKQFGVRMTCSITEI